jgi:hypothetical protein
MTVGDSAVTVRAVRPHLYIALPQASSLTMQILNSGATVIATSETVTVASITTANYFHGYVRFYIDAILAAETNYTFRLQASGYTYSDSSFVGWCSDFDLRKYSLGFSPLIAAEDPLDMEIWEQKLITRGTYP